MFIPQNYNYCNIDNIPDDLINAVIDEYIYTDKRVKDIGQKLSVYPTLIPEIIKKAGLPLRTYHGTHNPEYDELRLQRRGNNPVQYTVCPNCNEKFILRPNQSFCHVCGAHIDSLEDKCKLAIKEAIKICECNHVTAEEESDELLAKADNLDSALTVTLLPVLCEYFDI